MASSNDFYVNGNNHQSYNDEIAPEYASTPFQYEQQIEEERLREDILTYLVKHSNGAYHFSVELRTLTRDVVGLNYKASREEFEETESSLLDLLYSDPQRRFSIIGEGDHIVIKRAPLDKDEVSNLVEDWRCLIADFLLESKRVVCLSDIGSSVPRPARILSSVKLISIMKTDPLNRFILQGDGNAAKVRYNMQTDPDQESLWIAKWRDDIASLLNRQQWSGQSVGIQEIEGLVVRPFFLHPDVQLLEVLAADPFHRFVIIGFGIDTQITIRNFRGDEPEIEEFVEHWRLLIADYLISKSAIQGVTGSHPLLGLGLSQVGAYVPRPLGVPGSVKLIDVMRGDPINRFLISGEGNALRAMIVNSLLEGHMNVENRHYQNMDHDLEEYGRISHNNNHSDNQNSLPPPGPDLTTAQKQHQILNSHSEWKARLGSSGNQNQNPVNRSQRVSNGARYEGQNTGQYGGQESYGGGYIQGGLSMRQRDMDIQGRYNTNSPPMMNRPPAPSRDQYQGYQENRSQYREEEHDRYPYQSQSNHFQRDSHYLSPLQQFHMLPGSNEEHDNQYFNNEAPLDWNSLSQKEFTAGMQNDLEYLSLIPLNDNVSIRGTSDDGRSLGSIGERMTLNERLGSAGDVSPSSGNTDRDSTSNYSASLFNPTLHSNNSDAGGLGSLFSGPSGFPLKNETCVNRLGDLNDGEVGTSATSDDNDQFLSVSIPLDKWMIKTWLPIVFNGFDYSVIDVFIDKLRDNGGFVTLQDLLDAQSKGELTRETLGDIAGLKVGHCNRLEKALAAYR
mmetsp:Transcript_32125/g.30618  ORF Transcript_32125/g.30618 Transcript_32125/m.30618 type:complete len:787 (-) Transcript_32125:234-2594(-)|eukprot:CAMPEP_0119051416 /NCGR_PEP_ID=MMETSP1177-20130426/73034_1 /TAXON_ID=2985 /ORGANISM="Ochromonas sp, Strain CCMP1899" /LENGTH=786 /DNA_ID=CAMNT_0007030607 /DNA_START=183 /DNA_END=2543 /DNA_ORIENTATION=+